MCVKVGNVRSNCVAFMERVLVKESFLTSFKLNVFPLLNRLQLPPAHAVRSLQSLRSSPLPTTTITHISVIQFIVPFVRLRESEGGRVRGQNSYLHSVSLRCHWIDRLRLWTKKSRFLHLKLHKRIKTSECAHDDKQASWEIRVEKIWEMLRFSIERGIS